MKIRIMYIEFKGESWTGEARIGRVHFSKSGKSIHYNGKTFQTLGGQGYKANYFDVKTGEHYWISGCKKDGGDRLYGERIAIHIDEDAGRILERNSKPPKQPEYQSNKYKMTWEQCRTCR